MSLCLQYHGGTNFGRTSAHFVTPRYYDEAPLDEFGENLKESSVNLLDFPNDVTGFDLYVLQVCQGNRNGVTSRTCIGL